MEKYEQRKILFRDTKRLLSDMPYRGSWRSSSMSLCNSSYSMVAPLSTCTVEELRIQWMHYVLWNLRCWNIHHTVRTWRRRTFTSPVKEHSRDQKFADGNEVMEAVQSWFKTVPKSFLLEGNCKLVDIWTECVAKQGDCQKIRLRQFL